MDRPPPKATDEGTPVPERLTFKQSFQFLRNNFAVVSALFIASGIALSTLFLFSYLSVFDWHLIWLVQYSDVLSFGLVALGVLGTSVFLLNPYFYIWHNTRRMEPPARTRWAIGIGVFIIILLAWSVWSSIERKEGYFHTITGVLVVSSVVVVLFLTLRHIRAGQWPESVQVVSFLIMVFVVTYQSGRWLADIVLETNWFVENVQTKNESLKDAKLVIVMSRFTVFLKDNVLHVYPTADITELQTDHKLSLVP